MEAIRPFSFLFPFSFFLFSLPFFSRFPSLSSFRFLEPHTAQTLAPLAQPPIFSPPPIRAPTARNRRSIARSRRHLTQPQPLLSSLYSFPLSRTRSKPPPRWQPPAAPLPSRSTFTTLHHTPRPTLPPVAISALADSTPWLPSSRRASSCRLPSLTTSPTTPNRALVRLSTLLPPQIRHPLAIENQLQASLQLCPHLNRPH